VARVALTELAVQKLKPAGKQITYWDKTTPGFGVRVSLRSKSYVLMKGKDRRLVTLGRTDALTLKEARQAAMAELIAGTPHKLPVDKLKARYLEDAQKRLSAKTIKEYQNYLEGFDYPLGVLTLAQVREYLKQYEAHPTAQNYAFASLRAFLNWCLREGIITGHPLHRIPRPNRLESRERVLTDDELKAIWKHTDYRPFGHIVRCLMLSGCRRLEIGNAKAEQVTDVFTLPDTKNREPHVLPLTPLLKEHLKPPFKFNSWSKYKSALDTKCGVEGWTLHDLRRTFATNCAKLNIPIHIIERILNHKTGSISGVAKIYNRYSYLKEMEEALLQWEAHIRKITTPEG
jgi:integrase